MIRRIALYVAIGLLTIAMLPLLNTAAHKGYLGNSLRWWAQFLAPKRDLYERLFEGPIGALEAGNSFQYQFRHRYPGRHTFGVVASNELSMLGVPYWAKDLDLLIECTGEGKQRFKAHSDLSGWWAGRESGFTLAVYRVPRDLPLNGLVRCTVTVVKGDLEFEETYAPRLFYARKSSEQ